MRILEDLESLTEDDYLTELIIQMGPAKPVSRTKPIRWKLRLGATA